MCVVCEWDHTGESESARQSLDSVWPREAGRGGKGLFLRVKGAGLL